MKGLKVRFEGCKVTDATLTDPAGKPVQAADNILRAHPFTVELPELPSGAVWEILLERPSQGMMEDFTVELLGVSPLLAGSAEAVLVMEG